MLSMVWSAAVNGIDAYPKEVEVNSGYWATVIVILSSILPIGLLALVAVQTIAALQARGSMKDAEMVGARGVTITFTCPREGR